MFILGSHTSDRIATKLIDLMSKWPVFNDEKIQKFIVTDNGKNIVGAVRELQNTWTWLPCFAHIIQLCISDAKKHVQAVENVLSRARAIVTHFHHSAVANNLLCKEQEKQNAPKHVLVQMVATRWNSEYYMLQRLLEQRSCVSNVLLESDTTNLTGVQWKLAENLHFMLQPLEEITRLASGDSFPTLSQIIPCLYTLVLFYENNDKTGAIREFCEALSSAIKTRFKNVMKSDIALSAMALDPRYKLLVLKDDEAMLSYVSDLIINELKSSSEIRDQIDTVAVNSSKKEVTEVRC